MRDLATAHDKHRSLMRYTQPSRLAVVGLALVLASVAGFVGWLAVGQ